MKRLSKNPLGQSLVRETNIGALHWLHEKAKDSKAKDLELKIPKLKLPKVKIPRLKILKAKVPS